MRKISKMKKYALLFMGVLGLAMTQSCKEDIDMSDRYTFTQYTVSSYLSSHDTTYSEYYRLLGEVKISSRSQSTVLQLMGARGNFTVFAPTNKAIQTYLDSLCSKGLITEPTWEGFQSQETLDSIRKVIVFNSIIDSKDNNEAYQTSSFKDGEELLISNLYDRKLTVVFGKDPDSLYVNGKKDKKTGEITDGSLIDLKNRDIVAINGCIHQMHQVVAPSNESVADILKNYIDLKDERFLVTAKMIEACGLFDTLSKVKDEVWEQMYLNEEVAQLPKHPTEPNDNFLPEHRYYGYTIFAETNDVWEEKIGKHATEITVEDIKDWVVNQNLYPNAKDNGKYNDPENVLNQFVTYHILPVKLPTNKLVIHYNEKGYRYNPSSNPYTIPTWELHTTMGKRRLMKLYEGGKGAPAGIYINRFPVLDNGRRGTYHELSCDADKEGIQVNTTEYENPVNAYIYPINEVLAYDEATRENFQKQRLRFDVSSFFPEFMNNDIRDNRVKAVVVGIPETSKYRYLEDVDIMDGTLFYYLGGYNRYWNNWQGDELNIVGSYEMIFRLPPVPMKGIYEIRYAVQNNSGQRGMCQVYFGSDKNRMPAVGIPLDLRIGGTHELLGWTADSPTDDDLNAENDKKMRNNGFMKGAENYCIGSGTVTARAEKTTTRRIIVRQEMDPDETYYLKFKTVLSDKNKQFYMDYIEYCAKEVYDNPMTPEDIW